MRLVSFSPLPVLFRCETSSLFLPRVYLPEFLLVTPILCCAETNNISFLVLSKRYNNPSRNEAFSSYPATQAYPYSL